MLLNEGAAKSAPFLLLLPLTGIPHIPVPGHCKM
jgi:hypothetical protein